LEALAPLVVKHRAELVGLGRAGIEVDPAVAVIVAPAYPAELAARGRQAHGGADADQYALIVAIEPNLPALERHGQIEVAVVIEVAPGVGQRSGHGQQFGLDPGHGRFGRARGGQQGN